MRVYPVTLIPPPDDKIIWTGTPNPQTPALQKRQRKGGKDADAPEKDVFSTHIQTQIDQLRAKGLTGKGLRVGVIDTGVSLIFTSSHLILNRFGGSFPLP